MALLQTLLGKKSDCSPCFDEYLYRNAILIGGCGSFLLPPAPFLKTRVPIHLGSCSFGIPFIWDPVHLEFLFIWGPDHLGFPFIWDPVHLGSRSFGISPHLGSCSFGIPTAMPALPLQQQFAPRADKPVANADGPTTLASYRLLTLRSCSSMPGT